MSHKPARITNRPLAAPAPAHKRRIAELTNVAPAAHNTASPAQISIHSDQSDDVQLVRVPIDPNHPSASASSSAPARYSNSTGAGAHVGGGTDMDADMTKADTTTVYAQANMYVQQNTMVNDPAILEHTVHAMSAAANAQVNMAAQEAANREDFYRYHLAQQEGEINRLRAAHEEQVRLHAEEKRLSDQQREQQALQHHNDMVELRNTMALLMQQHQKRDTPSPTLQYPAPRSPQRPTVLDPEIPEAPPGLSLPETQTRPTSIHQVTSKR